MIVDLLKTRKAVATAIGAILFITIVMASITTIWSFSVSQGSYQKAREEMLEWDIQRISESLFVKRVESSSVPSYTLNLTVDNVGGIAVSVARIYIYDQTNNTLCYYDRQEGIGNGFINGLINVGEVDHQVLIKGNGLDGGHIYRYVLVTDRGRLFSRQGQSESTQQGTQIVPAVITFNQQSFEYAYKDGPTWSGNWYGAWVKPRKVSNDRQIYRINVTNVGPKDMLLHVSSHMRQEADDVSDAEACWWIVDPGTNPTKSNPTVFTSEIIPKGTWRYVYFAASSEEGGVYQGDPTSSHYYIVFIHIFFNYQGETFYYGQTVGIMSQKLT